ncbi:DUF1127 domain-containing protein [Tropicimonas aquimaris]|uniref:DUF1127 domain-containing protein n=1 Tax=Tropicimonas aquimaris TaxID=914152 RepID=A0ABW3IS70_9RHOB
MENAIRSTAAINGNSALTGVLGAARTRLAQYRLYRQTVRELSSLSDRNLADLGLSRSMIRGVARETAYAK